MKNQIKSREFKISTSNIAILFIALFFSANLFSTNRYWIGGTGNWSNTAHWSNSSGGASCGCTPATTDNVYFDANSFTANGQGVTIDVTANCDSMNWAGITFSTILTGSSDLHIYGSLSLNAGMNLTNYTGNIYFSSTNIGNTITSAGRTLYASSINFNGAGTWILIDAFAANNALNLTNGTLTTNNQNLNCGGFTSTGSNPRSLILGSSIVSVSNCCSSAWTSGGSNFSLNAGTSLIKFTNTNSYTYLTAGANDTYYDVLFVDPNTSGNINGGTSNFHNVTVNGGGTINPGAGSTFNNITFNNNGGGDIAAGVGSTFHNVYFNASGTINPGAGCSFNNVTFNASANINTSSNTFNDVVFNGTATVSNTTGTFTNALFKSNASITSNTTFDSLIFSAGYVYTLTYNTTQTINNYFGANGNCSQLVTLQTNSAGNQATISKASGAVTANYTSMRDMNSAGGATFTANNTTNLGDNTSWILTSPTAQNLYWIGGTGNWSNPLNWSTTSGGAGGGCIPTRYDNVHFDANSFSSTGQIVTVDLTAYCDSMDWGNISFPCILNGTSDLHVYGSLRLAAGLNLTNYTGNLNFNSPNAGNNITTAGRNFAATTINFNGAGSWGFQDVFSATNVVNLLNGSVNTNSFAFNCGAFASTGNSSRSLVLGTSTVTVANCCAAWNIGGSNFSLSAGTSLIKFTNTNSYTYLTAGTNDTYYDVLFVDPNTTGNVNGGTSHFRNVTCNGGGNVGPAAGSTFNNVIFNNAAGAISAGNGSSFNNVTFAAAGNISTSGSAFNDVLFNGNAVISNAGGVIVNATLKSNGSLTSNNTFDSLLFTTGYTYTLTNGTTQNINNYFSANGTCGQLINILSNSAGNQASISKATGTVTVNYVSLKDMNATGGATFNANNSTNLGNITGWNLNAPTSQNLYWVGGTGNWSSTSHWSNTSGGAPGTCLPTRYDNVYFDANSFTANGQSVTVDVTAYCDSMDWSGITFSTILTGSPDMHVYGSYKLSSNLNLVNYTGNLYFLSPNLGNNITSAGRTLYVASVNFYGGGAWTFQDAFACANAINLTSGSLNTNNNNVSCGSFTSTGNVTRSLSLGTSTVTVKACCSAWTSNGSNFSLLAGTSLIKFTNTNSYTYLTAGANDTYYDVLFVDQNTIGYVDGATSNYHNVTINGGGTINPGVGSSFNNITFNNNAAGTISAGAGSIFNNVYFNAGGTISTGAASAFNNVTFNSTSTINTSSSTFNDVLFNGTAIVANSGGSFENANFKNDGSITNNTTFDSLIFAAGHSYTITNNTTQTINNYFKADGTCTQAIILKSNSAGTQANISKTSGTVTLSYVNMKDMNATGGATFNAASSTNVSDNTGWNFPNATLAASYTHTQNALAVTFLNTSQYATAYQWNFGDGNTSTQQNPVHSFTNPGNYNVCLIASNACGTTDTLCQMLTVCSPLATGFTYTVTGQTVTFTNISQNANSYLWNFGDGNTSPVQNPIHTYFYGGGYNVVLITTSACGASDTIHQFISVNCTPPVAGFALNATGLLVSFVNSSVNAASILWKYGDGSTSTAFNASHTYYNSGTYNICLIVNNGCGIDSLCQNVTVTCVPPVASYTYSTSGMTINYTNTSTNAPVSSWDFGDGQTSTLNSPSHVYLNAGVYNVKLKINNGCGVDSVTQAITVVCVQPVANFVTNQQGLVVDFVSSSTNAPNVVWDFGDGSGISILPVVSHTFTSTGTYSVCLTASNGCGSNTMCMNLSVCTPPTANFSYTDSTLTLVLTNTSLNGTNYFWNFGDSSVTNLANPTHVYVSSGVHTICLNTSNACGFSQICKTITNYCSYYMNQEICLVTVDSLSNNNVVYWNKSNVMGIDSFILYREVTSNVYKKIGAVSKDSLSMFSDTSRIVGPANGDPNVGTYRYKIQVLDSCGNLGAMSPYHNTVYFIDNHTGTFTWNKYLIEGQANTPITQFNLLRDNNNNGTWLVIGTVSGTQTTLSDPNYFNFPIANWRVEALGFNCSATFRIGGGNNSTLSTVVKSKSNISNNRSNGINNFVGGNFDLIVYPNPGNGLYNLECSIKNADFQIVDLLGNVIKQQKTDIDKTVIDLSTQPAGTYILQMQNKHLLIIKQ